MTTAETPFDKLREQSAWFSKRAVSSRTTYLWLKGTQIVLTALIPVVSVLWAGDLQRGLSALLGAGVGIIEGLLQMGQYHQNWLLYRGTREALKREEFLYQAKAGPYAGAADRDTLYFERCDAVVTGENSKWLAQQQAGGSKEEPAK